MILTITTIHDNINIIANNNNNDTNANNNSSNNNNNDDDDDDDNNNNNRELWIRHYLGTFENAPCHGKKG